MQCHCKGRWRQGGDFFYRFLNVVFSKRVLPAAWASSTASAPKVLETASRSRSCGRRPLRQACCRRARSCLEIVGNHGHNLPSVSNNSFTERRTPVDITQLTGVQCEKQGIGLAPLCGLAAHDSGAWRCAAHQRGGAGPQAGARHGVRHHERRAAQALRRVSGDRLFV
jgi:hypothetical protein